MHPKRSVVYPLDSFPVRGNGKVDRRGLSNMVAAFAAGVHHVASPSKAGSGGAGAGAGAGGAEAMSKKALMRMPTGLKSDVQNEEQMVFVIIQIVSEITGSDHLA